MSKGRKTPCYSSSIDINGKYFCIKCGAREKGPLRNITHTKNCVKRGMKYCQQTKGRKSRKNRTRKYRR